MAGIRLNGVGCYLRALEPEDLDYLYNLENNTDIWEIGNTLKPFSKAVLKRYLENAHQDIYEAKQVRLCICSNNSNPLGFVDLFDFEPKHRRAGVGILILNKNERNKGVGSEALSLLLHYAYTILELHQVYANILEENIPSIRLFEKLGFQKVGIKKDWVHWNGTFKNEVLYQKRKP